MPDEIRVVEGFDPGESAGLFVGIRHFDDERFAEIPFAVDDAVDLGDYVSQRVLAWVRSNRPEHVDEPGAALYLASLDPAAAAPAPSLGQSMPRARSFRPFTKRLWLDPKAPFLRKKGIWPQTARSFDVGAFHGHGMLAGCIAVRLFDPRGQPLGYAGRRLDPEQAVIDSKWKFPYGLPRNTLLYGYHRAPRLQKRGVVLVECPWGALRLHQLGIPAVALLGTHMSPRQRALLNEVPRVVLLMDGDEPGRSAARAISQRFPVSVVVDLPDGLDPDDLSDHELAKIERHLI